MSNDYTIRSVERALSILDIFIEKSNTMTLKEISGYTELAQPTVLRMLRTLEQKGYISIDESTKKYSIGYHAYMLGTHVDRIQEIHRICVPYMEELVRKANLVCHLAIMVDYRPVIIEKVIPEGKPKNELQSRVGFTVPVHCTSVGKVLASGLDDEIIRDHYTDRLERYTKDTITNIDSLLCVIQEVRQKGYASTHNEHENFVRCIAYPINNEKGEIICAISFTGIDRELEGEAADFCHRLLRETSRTLSSLFG